MKNANIRSVIIVSAILAANMSMSGEAPKGWFLAGSRPGDYETAVDREVVHSTKASASLKSTATQPAGFGTLMQMSKADKYRGKRVRMSGYVRAQEIKDWAGLWLRVDGPKGEPLGFDNMEKRPIKGTAGWKKYEIVLDVPEQAKELAYGVLLSGAGQVWMAELNFEVVDQAVATTNAADRNGEPAGVKLEPTNLNFEE